MASLWESPAEKQPGRFRHAHHQGLPILDIGATSPTVMNSLILMEPAMKTVVMLPLSDGRERFTCYFSLSVVKYDNCIRLHYHVAQHPPDSLGQRRSQGV